MNDLHIETKSNKENMSAVLSNLVNAADKQGNTPLHYISDNKFPYNKSDKKKLMIMPMPYDMIISL